jgi:uncharacterized membrane protein YfcA
MVTRDGEVIEPTETEKTTKRRLKFRTKFILGIGLLVGVFGAVGGFSWVYIHLIQDDPPPKLSFEQRDKDLAATTVVLGS